MTATLALVGDVMLGRGVNERIATCRPECFWADVLPLLRSADAVIANLECAITLQMSPWQQTHKAFHFRADPVAVEVLTAAGIRYVSLANNHTLDFQRQGLLDTLRHLDACGIAHAGAGADAGQASQGAIIDAAGLKVGLLSLTDNEPAFAATADRPGTNYAEISPTSPALATIERAAAGLRQDGATLVVLSIHWGPNMVLAPTREFRDFAHAALDRGIDVIHGHSAHVFQGVETYGGGLILYDTGDFLDDYAADPVARNDWSFLFLLEVGDGALLRLRMVPVRLPYARVVLAVGEEFDAICRRMRNACAALGTTAVHTVEGLAIDLLGAKLPSSATGPASLLAG